MLLSGSPFEKLPMGEGSTFKGVDRDGNVFGYLPPFADEQAGGSAGVGGCRRSNIPCGHFPSAQQPGG